MTSIKIKANTKQLDSIINSINNGMKDFKKPLKELALMQLKEINEAFNVDGRNIIGTRWEKLKQATTRQKIRLNINKGILQRSGKLRKSFKKLLLTNTRLVIGNTKTYYKYHQRGIKRIPQRQMLGHGNIMIKKTEILMNEYLLKLIQKGMK